MSFSDCKYSNLEKINFGFLFLEISLASFKFLGILIFGFLGFHLNHQN
ncbi:MAG: hypothetical protein Ct9H300mP5_3160 [Candidatus Pelagibacterales bacterium]|nr:MAG: hypothetical protein Ct9H300mP5_3160 [Pelagibacterales bacterium]